MTFRAWLVPAVGSSQPPGALLLKPLSILLTFSLFRGHRGLQASQAQLGSLQW